MRQLPLPPYNGVDVFQSCVAEVPDARASQNYVSNEPYIAQAVTDYAVASQQFAWHCLPRVPRGNADIIVAGSLSKRNLTDLYSAYMVATSGRARTTYDEIMVAAHGRCPFCGGIGQVHTLDHYLPKSNFPLYSVHPGNLVPCCRDCNTGKSSGFGTDAEQQPLHPYFDPPKFFFERWVFATVSRTDPVSLQFFCAPPQHWSAVEQARARNHFEDYDLARRYSIQAGAELAKVVDQRKGVLRKLAAEDFQQFLLEGAAANGYDLNGWNRTMHAALAATPWFCSVDFTDPVTPWG